MTNPKQHSWLGLVVNVVLVALAFGLLGLVIWQNRSEIRKVFGHSLDLRLLAGAFVIYLIGLVATFVRWRSSRRIHHLLIFSRITMRSNAPRASMCRQMPCCLPATM